MRLYISFIIRAQFLLQSIIMTRTKEQLLRCSISNHCAAVCHLATNFSLIHEDNMAHCAMSLLAPRAHSVVSAEVKNYMNFEPTVLINTIKE